MGGNCLSAVIVMEFRLSHAMGVSLGGSVANPLWLLLLCLKCSLTYLGGGGGESVPHAVQCVTIVLLVFWNSSCAHGVAAARIHPPPLSPGRQPAAARAIVCVSRVGLSSTIDAYPAVLRLFLLDARGAVSCEGVVPALGRESPGLRPTAVSPGGRGNERENQHDGHFQARQDSSETGKSHRDRGHQSGLYATGSCSRLGRTWFWPLLLNRSLLSCGITLTAPGRYCDTAKGKKCSPVALPNSYCCAAVPA